jgi:hypothetical protein
VSNRKKIKKNKSILKGWKRSFDEGKKRELVNVHIFDEKTSNEKATQYLGSVSQPALNAFLI